MRFRTNVLAFVRGSGRLATELDATGTPVYHLGSSRVTPFTLWRLIAWLRSHPCDVLHNVPREPGRPPRQGPSRSAASCLQGARGGMGIWSGLPVVATSVGGTPEFVEDHESGYLVAPVMPQQLD